MRTHFGLARYIRNRWLYSDTSPLMAALGRDSCFIDPDSVSTLLVVVLWRELHGEKLTDAALRDLLREHLQLND